MSSHPFGDKLRVRVNGILLRDNAVLLVNLKSPTRDEPFWTPPGGGVEFGESMTTALEREFLEETGLAVQVSSLLFVSEYVKPPWHAVELYFKCIELGGELKKGSDPELDSNNQMIQDVQFIPINRLDEFNLIPEFLAERLPLLDPEGSDTPEWIR